MKLIRKIIEAEFWLIPGFAYIIFFALSFGGIVPLDDVIEGRVSFWAWIIVYSPGWIAVLLTVFYRLQDLIMSRKLN